MKNKDTIGGFSCSFCGKSQNEVQRLISGPSACICNECVVLAGNILLEENMISIGGVDKLKKENQELQGKLEEAMKLLVAISKIEVCKESPSKPVIEAIAHLVKNGVNQINGGSDEK